MAAESGARAVAWSRRVPYVHGTTPFALDFAPEHAPDCARCGTGLYPAELADGTGNRVPAFRCIPCGTYVEPGHVPDARVSRTGRRGPRV